MTIFQLTDKNTVSIQGELDRETLSKNWWSLLSKSEQETLQAQASCVFDLSSVTRVDSAGLAWLVNAIRDSKKHGISVRLQQVPEKLLKLAKISDVDSLLPLE